ncbi:MAG: hypothetical protein R3C15_15565 [Thermoleophilia bacterium]
MPVVDVTAPEVVERLARTGDGRTRLYLLAAGWEIELTARGIVASRGDRRVEALGPDLAARAVELFLVCMRSPEREEQLGWKV